jgi:hypothetical protein
MNRWHLLLSTILLLGLFPHAAQAQDALAPFPAFKSELERVLVDHNTDPQKDTYHFVILMNTVSTAGPEGGKMRNIYYGLLHHYLVPGDKVSFLPFQFRPRSDYAAAGGSKQNWNRDYSPEKANELYLLTPTGADPTEANGGHDLEGAMQAAARQAQNPESSVFILLSNQETSQPPTGGTLVNPADDPIQVGKGHLERVKADRYPKSGSAGPVIFYRLYLAQKGVFKPLGVSGPPRAETVKEQESRFHWDDKGDAPEPQTAGASSGTSPDTDKALNPHPTPPTRPEVKPESGSESGSGAGIPGWLLGTLIGLVMLGGAGGYYLWLTRPRSIQINHLLKSIRYSQPLYIAGEKTTGKNIAELPGVPQGQRVARLEVSPGGAVTMRGEGFYTVAKPGGANLVELKTRPQTVSVKDNRNNQPVCELTVMRKS